MLMLRQKIEAFSDTGQHPKAKHIDFQNTKGGDVILVPFDKRTVIHRGVFNGAQFIQSPFCDDKPAHMLRQMSRKPDDLAD